MDVDIHGGTMRIDAHQHFWDYRAHPHHFPWMGPGMDVLRRDHLPPDLQPLVDAAGLDGTVAVQAREMPEETDFLLSLAARHPFIRGVVGWLDLTAPGIEEALEAAAGHPLLKGLRMLIHDHPDPDFADSAPHRRGVALLSRHGLVYDLLLKPENLPSAERLVDSLPDQRFVLDHVAKPDLGGDLTAWREGIRRLATRGNVACKLSSLVTQAPTGRALAFDYGPVLDWALQCFGPDRLMIASDWPVCTLAASHRQALGVIERWAAGLAEGERAAVLGGTAVRVYDLA